ncbi:MAG: hypothetical protein K0S18_104 [Anaerocolumna sp.]|jgi:hypothetical protein|nr:hypothetical protein [Anaerocolumna sp.]
MAINVMCMNDRCKFYWEDNCMRNLNEERIEISKEGKCETFEEGVSEWYAAEEQCANYKMHNEVYAELTVINCSTCKHQGKQHPHTCDICT